MDVFSLTVFYRFHCTAVAAAKIQAMMIAQGIPVKPPPLKLEGSDEGSSGTDVCDRCAKLVFWTMISVFE